LFLLRHSAFESRQPSSSTRQSDASSVPQSIVLPSFSPRSFPVTGSPYSVQSTFYNSPSSSSPLYTSPLVATQAFTTPRNSRVNPNCSAPAPASSLTSSKPSGPQPSTSSGRQSMRARTPSQLSKSFSIVDVPPISDLPELHVNVNQRPPPTNAMVRNNSTSRKPRKLEKRRRSASLRRSSENLRRSSVGDGRSELGSLPIDLAGSGSDRENVGKTTETPQIALRHANSFQLPLSDSDQSTRTVVPLNKSKTTPSPAGSGPANPPSSFISSALSQPASMQSIQNQDVQRSSQPLIRQRSGIRQP
jgi:hypothetical protein